MKNKAQTAMEYLMTYGWAILIIIVVVAALYALGVFSVRTSIACSPCFSYFAYRDYDVSTNELHLRNGARSLSSLTIDASSESGTGFLTKAAAAGGVALDCAATTCNAGIDVVVTGVDVSGGTVKIVLSYTDADTGVAHTDTGTIQG